MGSVLSTTPRAMSDFATAYPNSRKVYANGSRVRVPMREVTLSDGEAPVRLYDTSGPESVDTHLRAGDPS